MISSFSISGGNATVTFQATSPTSRMQAITNSCSEYLWNHGYGNHGPVSNPILFSSLSYQEKLNLVGEHLQKIILNIANEEKMNKALSATRAAEELNLYSTLSLLSSPSSSPSPSVSPSVSPSMSPSVSPSAGA